MNIIYLLIATSFVGNVTTLEQFKDQAACISLRDKLEAHGSRTVFTCQQAEKIYLANKEAHMKK